MDAAPAMISGSAWVGHGIASKPRRHCASSGSRRVVYGLVGGTLARVVVKKMHLVQAVAFALLFDREQEFGNQRRDAGDGVWGLKKCGDFKAGVLHAALHALADDPDAPRIAQRRECLRHQFREAFVELSDHA